MHTEAAEAPSPRRVEIPRISLYRDVFGRITVRSGRTPGVTSSNQLLDSLAPGEEFAVAEFWRQDHEGWFKEDMFREDLLHEYPSSFTFHGKQWHLIGGTINGAGRGELLACTRKEVLARVVPGWDELDGLSRLKCVSRLMQPSITGQSFQLRLLVVEDPIHDGDSVLTEAGVQKLRQAFLQPDATVFKCISDRFKVVFRKHHPRWDDMPEVGDLDGVLYAGNIKLGKTDFRPSEIIELTEQDIRLHATERHTNFHRAGLSRQLLQYLPAEVAEPLIAASDIPLVGSNWAKALTGDVDALKYLLHYDPDDNAEDHEIRSQLLRHLDAGCQDVTIPYLRQRVMPILTGIFRNRVRKGRCPGAYLYAAPSTRLGKF